MTRSQPSLSRTDSVPATGDLALHGRIHVDLHRMTSTGCPRPSSACR